MTKELYMVVKTSGYDHGCLGVFDTFKQADNVAYNASKCDDGYHTYEVRTVKLNASNYSIDFGSTKRFLEGRSSYCDAISPEMRRASFSTPYRMGMTEAQYLEAQRRKDRGE